MQKLVLSIPKVYFKPTFFPIYSLQVPDIYLNYGEFTWRVSDCEEFVGEVNHTTESVTDLAKSIS